jgi:L-asparaginase
MARTPRVALIRTGGTIDSIGASRLDLAWYHDNASRVPDGALVESIDELADTAKVDEITFRRLSSSALTTADWLDLAQAVASTVGDSTYDGVVIAHGTNTLEETAYFLHLTIGSAKPVVLVGAMRPASALGTDGNLNLLRAVQVAADPQSHGHGVLVVMNDAIFSARDVTKTSTYRVDAFRAPDLGPLGYADADGRVVFYHRHLRLPDERSRFDVAALAGLPRVDIVVSYVGADGALVDAAVVAGARGIVSAGTGAGRTTPAEDEAVDRAIASGVVVCHSSRVGAGRVARSPVLARRRVVVADNLPPWKAKVLLTLALTQTNEPDVIQSSFDSL